MNKERLLNVAKACREAPEPDRFDMGLYGYRCGSPGCAWGHYCARTDLQSEFRLIDGQPYTCGGIAAGIASLYIEEHLGISGKDVGRLFSPHGCGEALTPTDAAEYIERFVEQDGEM